MLSLPSLQSNIIMNYIQNSSSDDDIQILSDIINNEKLKRRLIQLIPEDIKLRNKISDISHKIKNIDKKIIYTWNILFKTDNVRVKLTTGMSINILHLYLSGNLLWVGTGLKINLFIPESMISELFTKIGIEMTDCNKLSFLNFIKSYVKHDNILDILISNT